MITYQWCAELSEDDQADVLALVTTAARFDEEAGFSRIDPADVRDRARDGVRVLHLPIKARRDLSPFDDVPMVVVAYLHLRVDGDGLGTVSYVVHPDYRSRGITTQLVEELGLDVDKPDGWVGTGATALRCWAYSTHPAAVRLTTRFDIPAVSRQWTLLRHLTGPFALEFDAPAVPDGLTIDSPRPVDVPDARVSEVIENSVLPTTHRDRLEADLRRGSGRVITARDSSGAAVGFVWYSTDVAVHLELRAAPVHAVLLAMAARGEGLGTALLTHAMEDQREAGVQLSTLRMNPDDVGAVRMCRLLGYEQEEAHSCFQLGKADDPPPPFR